MTKVLKCDRFNLPPLTHQESVTIYQDGKGGWQGVAKRLRFHMKCRLNVQFNSAFPNKVDQFKILDHWQAYLDDLNAVVRAARVDGYDLVFDLQ